MQSVVFATSNSTVHTHRGLTRLSSYLIEAIKGKTPVAAHMLAVRRTILQQRTVSISSVFSERELKFMFAICHRASVCLSSVCRL